MVSLGLSSGVESNFDLERRRLVIPVEFRNLFEDTCVVTLGRLRLLVYKPEDWEKMAIWKRDKFQNEARVKNELDLLDFYSSSKHLTIDRQRRIVIPQDLISEAKLEREVMIIGAGDHMQVWSKRIWSGFSREMREQREKSYLKDLKEEGINIDRILGG